MAVALGIVAGLLLGGVSIALLPGMVGVVVGMAAAALAYVGVSYLATPERRLGGQAASLLPNGESLSATLARAETLASRLSKTAGSLRDGDVRYAVGRLADALKKLTHYVEDNPAAHKQLAHFLNVYADQCASVLDSWRALEGSQDQGNLAEAKDDVLLALKGLTDAVNGELGQATDAHVAQIEASQEAIKRLVAMDGYGVGSPSEPTTPDGADQIDEGGVSS